MSNPNNQQNNKHTGKIKWFNIDKGYGFIELSNGTKDIFLHISAIEHMSKNDIQEGTLVEFEIIESKGKSKATNVYLI